MDDILQQIRNNLTAEEISELFAKHRSAQKPESGLSAAEAFVVELKYDEQFSKLFAPLFSRPSLLIQLATSFGFEFTARDLDKVLERKRLDRWRQNNSYGDPYKNAKYFVRLMHYDREFAEYVRGKSDNELRELARTLEMPFNQHFLDKVRQEYRFQRNLRRFVTLPLLACIALAAAFFWDDIFVQGWRDLGSGHRMALASSLLISTFLVLTINSKNKSQFALGPSGIRSETVGRFRSPGSPHTYETMRIESNQSEDAPKFCWLLY